MRKLKLEKTKVVIQISLFAYVISVIFIYLAIISPLFSYSGLTTQINLFKAVMCLILYIVSACLFPFQKPTASIYLFYLIYLICFIPTLMYTWMNDEYMIYAFYLFCCVLMIEVMLWRRREGNVIIIKNGNVILYCIFLFYVVSSIFLIIKNGGIRLETLDIYTISAHRQKSNISNLEGYILNWCAKSFTPMFFAYFFYKKKWGVVVCICFIQLFFYLSFGFKSFLFSIALLVLVGIMVKMKCKYFYWMPLLFSFIIFGSYILYKQFEYRLPLYAFAYRTLYIPSQGQFQYYDFFTHNEYLKFSEGMLGRVLGINYPYSNPIGVVVNQYLHGVDFWSNGNTGIFSYGFADLGFLGMILASLILVIVFGIIDQSARKIPTPLIVAAMSYQMILLNDVNIQISLNSGGVFWSLVMLLIMECTEENDNNWRIRVNKYLY